MAHSRKLCGKQDDKEEQSCNPSPFIDKSGFCDEVLSHKEGGISPQKNTFFNFFPSGISPHKGGMRLLGSVEEKEDIHAEACEESENLVLEILSERVDVSLEEEFVSPFLRSLKYHPDSLLEENISGHLSHE